MADDVVYMLPVERNIFIGKNVRYESLQARGYDRERQPFDIVLVVSVCPAVADRVKLALL